MPIVHTSLFCHAPIVIPQIGGARGAECALTTTSMRELAREVLAAQPDVIIVVSPHTPRLRGAVPIVEGAVRVDFGSFGADLGFLLPPAEDLDGLIDAAKHVGVVFDRIELRGLDHGAGVPLAFLHEAGWRGPTVVVGLPYDDDDDVAKRLGLAMRAWSHALRVALVASGDGSHRLKPGAPSGHHPDAHKLDAAVRERLERGDDAGLYTIDPDLRELAAEDIVTSLVVATAAAGHARRRRVLSYEGPYGVGYTVAVLDDPGASLGALDVPPRGLLRVARDSIEAHFGRRAGSERPALDVCAYGVMVSWHNASDDGLRGCLGHVPERAPIVDAVAALAVAAATQDPRFDGVGAAEIDDLRATITLVGQPERVGGVADLDPKHWGILVRAGQRQGVLLPDLEGVDTGEHQLRITLQKARIAPDEPYELSRFRAASITEGRP